MVRGFLSFGGEVVEIWEVSQEEVPFKEVEMEFRGRDVRRWLVQETPSTLRD
jgi:hypothetical protein